MGTRIAYRCPRCRKADRADAYCMLVNGVPTWVVKCFNCADAGLDGAAYLDALGAAWGYGEGRTRMELAWIAKREHGRPTTVAPRPLPSAFMLRQWQKALREEPAAMSYLLDVRGLSRRAVAKAGVGWDPDRRVLTFPMRNPRGRLVGFKTRALGPGEQMRSLAGKGRAWPLYPSPPGGGWTLLVAGDLDALRGRSAGLPAVSVTLGAGHWRDEWTEQLRGKLVVVCFDNNERRHARERVRQLWAAGIRARRLDLRKLGLTDPKGDLSDFLNDGGSPDALRPREGDR